MNIKTKIGNETGKIGVGVIIVVEWIFVSNIIIRILAIKADCFFFSTAVCFFFASANSTICFEKNSSVECNYEIYDKKMLTIIRWFEQWDAELRNVKFGIRTYCDRLNPYCFGGWLGSMRKVINQPIKLSLISGSPSGSSEANSVLAI